MENSSPYGNNQNGDAMSELSEDLQSTVVKVNLKYVRNLGNYESVHVELGVEDFKRGGETTSAAMDRVYSFVEGKLLDKVGEIESELKGRK